MLRNSILFLCATALIACAHRGTTESRADPVSTAGLSPTYVQHADADRDGKVSRDEAAADPDLARNFGRFDANEDGVLDVGEFAQFEEAGRRDSETVPGDTAPVERPERKLPVRPMRLNRTGIDELRPESE